MQLVGDTVRQLHSCKVNSTHEMSLVFSYLLPLVPGAERATAVELLLNLATPSQLPVVLLGGEWCYS